MIQCVYTATTTNITKAVRLSPSLLKNGYHRTFKTGIEVDCMTHDYEEQDVVGVELPSCGVILIQPSSYFYSYCCQIKFFIIHETIQ